MSQVMHTQFDGFLMRPPYTPFFKHNAMNVSVGLDLLHQRKVDTAKFVYFQVL